MAAGMRVQRGGRGAADQSARSLIGRGAARAVAADLAAIEERGACGSDESRK